MTEEEAQAWLADRGWLDGPTGARIRFVAELVTAESARQNLIAASTIPQIWARHIVDSAQLLPLSGNVDGVWIDLGSGGGFPGLIIAALREAPIILVETRALRARFLQDCVSQLGFAHAMVQHSKVEQLSLGAPAAIISARAFASLTNTFAMASHLCDEQSRWLLPKGRSTQLELASAQEQWQAVFHVEQSVTDMESAIVIASGVRRRITKPRSPVPARHVPRRSR